MTDELQRKHRESWAGKVLYALTMENGFWTVHTHMPNGSVYPPIQYATPHEAIARLMQLLDTGPVEPQTWPERVQVDPGAA